VGALHLPVHRRGPLPDRRRPPGVSKEQFEGFGDGFGGDPYGFFGWAGFVEFIKGPKFSLLFFWDTPTAFWLHLVAFWAACTCFIVGFKTKYAKWATFLLFNSIILRNQVFWEGTENVYRCFLFYLCLSRCGEAYSLDNWLRCRRLRKQGLLSEPGCPATARAPRRAPSTRAASRPCTAGSPRGRAC
jgi:uncharacterized membrane protein YphA (DoxX/SURF4 family)